MAAATQVGHTGGTAELVRFHIDDETEGHSRGVGHQGIAPVHVAGNYPYADPQYNGHQQTAVAGSNHPAVVARDVTGQPYSPGYLPREAPAVHGGAVYHPQNLYAPVVPETAAAVKLLPGGDKVVVVPGASGAAPAAGRYPDESLVRLRSAPVLAAITFFLMLTFFGWLINNIVLVAQRDQLSASDEVVDGLTGPLFTLSSDFYYGYGHEGIDAILAISTCWAAVILRTRQLRATALFATTWVVFSWLIYTKFIFQGLDQGWTYCSDSYDARWCRLSKSNGAFSVLMEAGKIAAWLWALSLFITTRGKEVYCELDRADLEAVERHNARTAEEARVRALSTKESMEPMKPIPLGLADSLAPTHTRITHMNQCRISTPGKVVLFLCMLSTVGFIISMLGNINVQRLGNDTTQPQYAQQEMLVPRGSYTLGATSGNPAGLPTLSYLGSTPSVVAVLPKNIPQGDLNYFTNEVFPALLMFFAIGLSVATAYDRMLNVRADPILLTMFSSFATLAYFIYAARRIHLSQSPPSIDPAHASQVAIVVGMGITTGCEILRFFALLWLRATLYKPTPLEKVTARRCYYFLYIIFDLAYVLVLFIWLLVMLAIESESGLFNRSNDTFISANQFYNTLAPGVVIANSPQVAALSPAAQQIFFGTAAGQSALATAVAGLRASALGTTAYPGATQIQVLNNRQSTYLNGQGSGEDALVFPYQIFVISLLIGGWVIGINLYCRIRDDRVGNLVALSTFIVQAGGWWLMCWPVAYAAAFSEGAMYQIFCRQTNGSYDFSENLCNEVAAVGRLALIFWLIMMLNTFVHLVRWLTAPANQPLQEVRSEAAMEVGRVQMGQPARDPRFANILMVHEEKQRHSNIISFFLFLSLCGWIIWAASISSWAKRAYWMPAVIYPSLTFDLYGFIAVHYITLTFLLNVFIHAHLAHHPTLRHFHRFWRFGELCTSLLNIALCIPVIIYEARFINDFTTSSEQTAAFAGIVILVAGDVFNLIYCQSLFRRYPLFTTPAEYTHFTRRHMKNGGKQAAAQNGHLAHPGQSSTIVGNNAPAAPTTVPAHVA